MKMRPLVKGFSLVSVLMGATIIVGALSYSISSYSSLAKSRVDTEDKLLANAYATELLEVFRSYPARELLEVLASGASGSVPLCAHVNILDRSTGSIVNADPLAALPSNRLDRGDIREKANRFFQISVVDMDTLNVKTAPFCNLTPAAMPPLSASERLYVTVGVSWLPRGNRSGDISRVVMSTVLPR